MVAEPCRMCGGDGRIANSFGLEGRCPACHGSGRRSDGADGPILRDVTKTKTSHYQQKNEATKAQKETWPTTHEGGLLANEVRDSTTCTGEVKARLIREIIEYEGSHGHCTKTFLKKIRKQIRPPSTS